MVQAALLLQYKSRQGDLLLEMVLWQMPKGSTQRPHGVKYRLYLGRSGRSLVRYDNETGKGDHRHIGPDEREEIYTFSTIEKLLDDFRSDCEQLDEGGTYEADLR